MFRRSSGLLLFLALATIVPAGHADIAVTLLQTPDTGIQPQAAIDSSGRLHLLYYRGDAYAGDLYYAQRPKAEKAFSRPVRVNSEPGTAVAAGTVRGGQLALGKNDQVHIAWNGSSKAQGKHGSAMLYTRMKTSAANQATSATTIAFEPQQNLMTRTKLLDGGGSIAADDAGNVYVIWHANEVGGERSEQQRRVWIARSSDGGQTFRTESAATDAGLGACACCGVRAAVDHEHKLQIIFRAAKSEEDRDIYLLTSTNLGKSFEGARIDPWRINACPMSTMSFAVCPKQTIAAWETDGAIRFALLGETTQTSQIPARAIHSVPASKAKQHHPSVAMNDRGEFLIAWAEGTAWQRGGALAWQTFTANGEPTKTAGRKDAGIAVWSLPAAVAQGSDFTIVH